MREKQGLWIVLVLVAVAVALAITASSLVPVERTVWLQSAPSANADIVCVELPAAVRSGDTLVDVTADAVVVMSIGTIRMHCTPCEDMICATSSGIISCL